MTHSFFPYLLESGICLLAFYVLYLLLLRNEGCFGYNRFYLLGATVVSFLLPFLEVPAFQEVASLPAFVPTFTPFVVETAKGVKVTANAPSLEWDAVLRLVYGLGVLVFAFRFFRQLYRLQQFIQRHRKKSERMNGLTIIPTQGELPTFSFLGYIFWDNAQSLTQEEQNRILQHERVHVKQGHSYDLLYLEVLTIFFWFNPLLRLYRKALMATHEFLADAHVIQTEDKNAYGLLLAKQVLQKNSFALGHYFNKSLTLKRLKMIHEPNHRTSKVKQVSVFPLLGLLVLSLSSNQLPLTEPNQARSLSEREQIQTVPQAAAEPHFPGGKKELLKFIGQTFRIPLEAQKENNYGGVFVQATIGKDGTPGDFKVLQGSHPLLDQEALRVIQKMPKWEASASATTYIFPISVVIDGFKNDKNVIKQKFEQTLTQVASQASAKSMRLADPVVVVGYGPAE